MKRKKSETLAKYVSRLKKELDRVFSIYIRNKYAKNGKVSCYTCGKIVEVSKAHCGHFVSRQYLATRWDEDNCRPQEVGCNVFGNGQLLDFEEKLKREIGAEKVEALKRKRHEVIKLDALWYETQIALYKQKLETLPNAQN